MTTPLRTLRSAGSGNDLVVLAGALTPPLDSRVRRLRRLLKDAAGVPSWNPRLVPRAETDLDALEVEPGCANVLRSLDLDPRCVVLQLGAGTGLLTRYLAETVAAVDAVEPNVHLAEIAAARTRDLDSARVFAGTPADVPDSPAYDVIVAIDLLRDRTDDANDLIAQLLRRLAPGGSIVFAETNRLGVKYLVGAPEDCTTVVFDGIEGYPAGARHPALSRRELDEVLTASGLQTKVLLALPHHREVRALVDPEQLTSMTASLPMDLAPTPSPDMVGVRPKLADETAVWRQAVEAGLAGQLANSFVVLATVEGDSRLWPEGRLADYHSWRRSASFTSHTVVEDDGEGIALRRIYPHADAASEFLVTDSVTPFIPGRTVTGVLKDMDEAGRGEILGRWRTLVERSPETGTTWLDAHPGNVVVREDGSLALIDLEYGVASADASRVVRRGLLVAGRELAMQLAPTVWPSRIKVLGDVVRYLGTVVGIDADKHWLSRALDEEAKFQRAIAGVRGGGRSASEWRADLDRTYLTPLSSLPLGDRVFDDVERLLRERDGVSAENDLLRDGIAARVREIALLVQSTTDLATQVTDLNGQVTALENRLSSEWVVASFERAAALERETALRDEIHHRHLALEDLKSTRAVRAAMTAQRAVSKLLPVGTWRRKAVASMTRPFRRS